MRSLLACVLLAVGVSGQTLLRDINTSVSTTARTTFGTSLGLADRVLFAADDFAHGLEPCVLDGTGARLVLDLYPGPTGSRPGFLASLGGVAVFTAIDEQGAGLWLSDGTAAGTTNFFRAASIDDAVVWNGALWFWTFQGVPGAALLWKSTAANPPVTQLVATLPSNSRLAMQMYAVPTGLVTLVGSTAIFSDGTAAGTSFGPRLWDIALGGRGVVVGAELLFPAGTASTGLELWKTDGTPQGTRLVKDLVPGADASYPGAFVALAGKVAFRAGDGTTNRLWISDGTAAGTTVLGGAEVGAEIVANGSVAYFSAFRGGSGSELWTSDGTVAGTREVANIAPTGDSSPSRFVFAGSRVFFAADDGTSGREPWSSDGTTAGTRRVQDVRPGAASSMPNEVSSGSRPFAALLGGLAYFGADDGVHGYEIWRALADGTSATLVTDLNGRLTGDAGIEQIVVRDREAFFVARDHLGLAIWRTDGTPAGTRVAIRNVPNTLAQIDGLMVHHGRLIFRAIENAAGSPLVLFASDGSESGTVRLTQPFPYSPYPFTSVVFQDRVWFPWRDAAHGSELFTTDGTVAGTGLALDLAPGPADSNPKDLASTGERLFCTTSTSVQDSKLWSSDGTLAGSVVLASGGFQLIFRPVVLGNLLVYIGGGTGLMRSDGTVAGTFSLDPTGGSLGVVFKSRYWYAKLGGGSIFAELWSSDGTLAGTRLEQAFPPVSNASTSIGSMAAANGRLYFTLYTLPTGQELWSTDGSPNGAALVREIAPGSANGTSGPFANLTTNTRLLFPGFDPLLGTELFVSDGTASGTRLVADVNPGPGLSTPKLFTRLQRQVLFVADDGVHGAELFAMDLAKVGAALAVPFAEPCGASAARIGALGAPTLGSFGFWLTLAQAPRNAPALWLLGGARQDLPLYGCTLRVAAPWLTVGGVTAPSGAAVLSVPVPADPRLLGSDLFAQVLVADQSWFTLSDALQVLVGQR